MDARYLRLIFGYKPKLETNELVKNPIVTNYTQNEVEEMYMKSYEKQTRLYLLGSGKSSHISKSEFQCFNNDPSNDMG